VIPPNADLEFNLEMLAVTRKKLPSQMTCAERVEAGLRKKKLGNDAYKTKNWDKAVKMYRKGLEITQGQSAKDTDAPELPDLKKTCLDCANNIAQAYIMMGKDKEAKDACINVLKLDHNNVKALARAATLCIKENEFEEADAALKKGLKLDPENVSLKKAQKKLVARKKAYRLKQQKMFGGKLKKKKADSDKPASPKAKITPKKTPAKAAAAAKTTPKATPAPAKVATETATEVAPVAETVEMTATTTKESTAIESSGFSTKSLLLGSLMVGGLALGLAWASKASNK